MLRYFKPVGSDDATSGAGSKRARDDDSSAAAAPSSKQAKDADAEAKAVAQAELEIRKATVPGDPEIGLLQASEPAGSAAAPAEAGAGAGASASAVDPVESLKAAGIDVHPSWAAVLLPETRKPYFKRLLDFVQGQRAKATVYPPVEHVYSALALTPLDSIKVVILGQDPYHGPGQAHGLAFSVQKGVQPPPSLVNILKEVDADIGPSGQLRKPSEKHGNLEYWARQGVLMLNAVLTVEKGSANAHQGKGWEEFTSAVINAVAKKTSNVVFMLWGLPAQKKGSLVDKKRHLVLEAPHPSPLSAHRGFLGCRHFSKANGYLKEHGKAEIDWSLDPPANGQGNAAQANSSSGSSAAGSSGSRAAASGAGASTAASSSSSTAQ